jgi:putative ABC transport system permease protein
MFRNYLKIAFRTLRSQWNYTLLNLVGLAVGLAGGLLIFLFVRYHLSTDRHHAKFERIFRVNTDLHLPDGSVEYGAGVPLPLAQVLRESYPAIEHAAFLSTVREVTVSVRQPGRVAPVRFREHRGIGFVEPEWFDMLDYTWLRGTAQTALRAPNQVVLTESWAKKYFGNTDPVGQVLTLDNRTRVRVTGVLADPSAPTDTPLGAFVSLATLTQWDSAFDPTDWTWLNSTSRLYVTLRDPAAASRIQQSFSALTRKHYGKEAHIFRFGLQPMREFHFDVARGGGAIRASLLWSLGVVGFLLVGAACINFVNLATAQALRRSKEVGVRKTLGSSRGQLIRQFLLETALITLTATGLALVLVPITRPLFEDWTQVPLPLFVDGTTVLFVGSLLIGVVLLAGGYPAAVLSGFAPWAALRGKPTASAGGLSVRRLLVVTQFAVCQALILGALVVANQIRFIQQTDLGFRTDNVVVVPLPTGSKSAQETFKQTLSRYSDVQSVSLSHRPPSSAQLFGGQFKFDGKPDWEPYPIRERLADADYLSTYGLTLLAGRNLQPSDTIREYLINETLLHKLGFQQPQQALGRRLQHYLSPIPLPIVGVVKDFHQQSLRQAIEPCVVTSRADWYAQAGVRLSGQAPAQSLERIRQTWQRVYPNDVFEYRFLKEQIAEFYQTELLTTRLINVFTGLAILICCLGLYGLVSYAVVQRTKEIGVRKVLGASVVSIVTLLSKDFLKLVLLAIVIASPLAWYVMRHWLQDFAYKIDIAWWVFALAGLLAVGIALLTVSFQAIKAALMNPVKSLRSE